MAFFCVKCGKVLETSDKFCKYCGTPVAYNNNGSAYGKDTIPASLKKTDDSLNSTDSNTSSSSTYKKSDQNYNTGNRTAQQSSIDRILTFIIEMIKNLGRFLWKTTKEHIIPRLKSLCGFLGKIIKERFLPWVKALDKRIKVGVGIGVALLIMIPLIWWNGFKKPYDNAVKEFSVMMSSYNTAYNSYDNAVNQYNETISLRNSNRENAVQAIESMETTMIAPETDDEELLNTIRERIDDYKAYVETEPVSSGDIIMYSKKNFSADNLGTKEIRALSVSIKEETDTLMEETTRVSGLNNKINTTQYSYIIQGMNTLKKEYNDSVAKVKARVTTPIDSGSVAGKKFTEIADMFEGQGFTDVKVEGLGDIDSGSNYYDGEVKEVSIDGSTTFTEESQYDPDKEIVIRFHSPEKISLMKYGEEAIALQKHQIHAPGDSISMRGKNYEDVYSLFEKKGFSNIKIQGMGDIIIGLLNTEGAVEEISINGKTDYSTNEWYDASSVVIIRCHSMQKTNAVDHDEYIKQVTANNDNASTEKTSDSSDNKETTTSEEKDQGSKYREEQIRKKLDGYKGEKLPSLKTYIDEMGYAATYVASNSGDDFTDWIAEDPSIAENFFVDGYANLEPENKTVTVYILGKDTVETQKKNASNTAKLESKIESSYAWYAAESYGKKQYSYFKLHYYMEKYAETAEDENTWFLKAGCTVKNAFGQKLNKTCEARVSGTNDNPIIESFIVY